MISAQLIPPLAVHTSNVNVKTIDMSNIASRHMGITTRNRFSRHWKSNRATRPTMSYRTFPGEWLMVNLKNGLIIDCSKELASLLGTGVSSLRSKALAAIRMGGEEHGWGLKELNTEIIQHPGRYEDVGLAANGDIPIVADVRVSHIQYRERRVAFCLIADKSQQRQLQGALITKHRELQQMVKKLDEARIQLNTKNRQLGKLSEEARTRSSVATIGEIAAELNHQLNNPLAAAMGANRTIKRMVENNDLEGVRKMTVLMTKALHSMKETTDEVKVIYKHSRIPDKEKERFDLADELQSTLMLLEQKMEDVSVTTHIEPQEIVAHRALVQHVLTNLIENAVEATDGIGRMQIDLGRDEHHAVIQIGDSGPGIPVHDRKRVFDAFYTTKKKGSGLGLAAVKRYTDRDHAQIEIGNSELGGREADRSIRVARVN
jgi:signal transduction histidine kinase